MFNSSLDAYGSVRKLATVQNFAGSQNSLVAKPVVKTENIKLENKLTLYSDYIIIYRSQTKPLRMLWQKMDVSHQFFHQHQYNESAHECDLQY